MDRDYWLIGVDIFQNRLSAESTKWGQLDGASSIRGRSVLWCENSQIERYIMYTIGQAAKATGKSIKGTISAKKNANGSYSINPTELHRVFPPGVTENGSSEPQSNYTEVGLVKQNQDLHGEIKLLLEQLTYKDNVIDDLRQRLAKAEEERKLALMIYGQQPQPEPIPPPPRKGLWGFLHSLIG